MKRSTLLFAVFVSMLFCAFNVQAQYGIITTVAGGNSWTSFAGDGGPATASTVRFERPTGVSTDSVGDIFIYDMDNARIRKVDHATGILTTIAGNGTSGYSGDGGPAVVAEIGSDWSSGLCADRAGNCFIVDGSNSRIRRIDYSTGIITTVAGNGSNSFSGDGGLAISAAVGGLQSVYVDNAGDLYITTSNRIRKVTASTGIITTIAGTGASGFTGDGGPATAAKLGSPYGVTCDLSGNVYISDQNNYRIRKVNTTGIITTIAGNGAQGYSGDGGPATAALVNQPEGIGTDSTGNVYFHDQGNNVIRKVDVSSGIINTVAGNYSTGNMVSFTTGKAADSASIDAIYISVDRAGNIYYTDGAGWTNKITGSGTGINTMSVTDSLASIACTLPATVAFGIDGTINGIPLSSDSVKLSVNFGQFSSNSKIVFKLPYWYLTTYGFGSIYNVIGNYTYKLPGIYTPVITLTTLDGYTDVFNAPAIQVGNTCSSSVTGITITSAADSFISVPCSIPMNVRFVVNGTITGSPSTGDSVYIAYQYNSGDTSFDLHVAPYNLVGSVYHFTDTIIHPYTSGGYHPEVMAITSSGAFNASNMPMAFVVNNCSNGSVSGSITDTAFSSTYCSLPFANEFSISGTLHGNSDTCTAVHLYVNYGDGTDTSMTVPVYTDGLGSFYYGNGSGLGSSNSIPITLYHTYTMVGGYTATLFDTAGSVHGSSASTLRTIGTDCSPVSGRFYIDANANCTYDPGERLLGYWPYTLINNTLNDSITGWCDDSGYYALELINGDNYTLVADPFSNYALGYGQNTLNTSCPATGIYTVTATSGSVYTQNFAFSCSPPSQLDMTVAGWGWGFVPGDTGVIGVWSSDYWGYMCDSLSSTITLTMDPLLTYVGMWDGPAPTSIAGNTLTWTFSTQANLFDFYADVKAVCSTSATMGANVCNTLYVSPTALTDPNLSNNTYAWCEPVSSSWDPNEKQVSPVGNGPQGYIPNGTSLSYLIHFQNTGTAIAKNITVSDTINSNLDISTLQVLNSSAPVLVYQMPGNVIDFKFNNINLPDSSSDPRGSIGYIAYNIMPNDGLAPGTQITNDAAIYFDYNPAVITNSTLNTIDTVASSDTTTGIQNISNGCYVYPNPANDILTIKINKGQYNSFTIVNNVGEIVIKEVLTNAQTNVNVKALPVGMYYISLKGDSGVVVRKFVKL